MNPLLRLFLCTSNTVHVAYYECLPTCLNSLAERTCLFQVYSLSYLHNLLEPDPSLRFPATVGTRARLSFVH